MTNPDTFPATYRTMYAGHADEPCTVTVVDGVHTATFTDGTVEVVPASTLTRMHEQADGSLVCVHRDLSVCPACAAHPAIVDVVGAHYFDADGTLAADIAGISAASGGALTIIDVNDDLTGEHVPAVEECPTCHAGPFAGETVTAALDNFDAHAARCNA